MAYRFDKMGRDMRSVDEFDHDETAGRRLSRLLLKAFGIAALIGLILGIIWTVAGLWHFNVSPVF